MTKNTVSLLVALVGLGLSGCSTTPSEELYAQQLEIERLRAEAEQSRNEANQDRLEEQLELVPEWVLSPLRPDATGMYGVGISQSSNLNIALKKSRLQAEFELAKLYRQELSGSERSYEQDNGTTDTQEQYTSLIDKLVENVPVVGFDVVKQEVKPINGQYHAFVLLRLPYDEFNKVIQQQRLLSREDKISAAFDDLEKRLDKRRTQRIEDAKLSHDREIERSQVAHKQSMDEKRAAQDVPENSTKPQA
ncbi:hypothetical protein K0504_09775 [Neiella marina]|uniref:Uncharacterized protein n=1 Tax=Neiella holothuriorum TaxID=2870530 RepID=A0ABS7EGD2_9GAMM|nr:hypothetical protein [Neiella holothuriorum]MBW8191325.1 hypothetical protein [Neiella holothuriorum]